MNKRNSPTLEQSSREQELRERATKMAHAGWTDVGISVNSLQMILRELLDATRPTLSGQTAEPQAEPEYKPRKLVLYGDCKCILTQYCDGTCNPIFEDSAPQEESKG